jgi:hypothetical protein
VKDVGLGLFRDTALRVDRTKTRYLDLDSKMPGTPTTHPCLFPQLHQRLPTENKRMSYEDSSSLSSGIDVDPSIFVSDVFPFVSYLTQLIDC